MERAFHGDAMIKTRTLYFRFLLISLFVMCAISVEAVGQKSQINAAAVKAWPQFWTAFRTAVKKRDRDALRRMISPKFSVPVDAPEGGFHSADDVIKWIDAMHLWPDLQKSLASGAKPSGARDGRPRRCTNDTWYCFEFGTDWRWRLVEQTGD